LTQEVRRPSLDATGILTGPAKDGPFGFCHFAARPGDLVALDTFYVGKLNGIGPVWQLTAVDTNTRHAVASLVAGDKSARDAGAFVDHAPNAWPGSGPSSPGCSATTVQGSSARPSPSASTSAVCATTASRHARPTTSLHRHARPPTMTTPRVHPSPQPVPWKV
jgi:hypothetical protein